MTNAEDNTLIEVYTTLEDGIRYKLTLLDADFEMNQNAYQSWIAPELYIRSRFTFSGSCGEIQWTELPVEKEDE